MANGWLTNYTIQAFQADEIMKALDKIKRDFDLYEKAEKNAAETMVNADFASIELRVLAHMVKNESNDIQHENVHGEKGTGDSKD